MKITVEFECVHGCDTQRCDFEDLNDLLGSLYESGWPICIECGEDTSYTIVSES